MYSKFHIKKYKCIEDLELKSLSTINLISGKNNTGKSSILEALYIYANGGNLSAIFSNFNIPQIRPALSFFQKEIDMDVIDLYKSIFHNREFKTNEEEGIELNFDNDPVFIYIGKNDKSQLDLFSSEDENPVFFENKYTLVVNYKNDTQVSPLDISINFIQKRINRFFSEKRNNQFIHTGNFERDTNSQLFDNLALTKDESLVIDALKIIEPRTERIAFVEKYGNIRTPLVKLKGEENTILLNSMGDGINRILTIILALINSKDGFLLIDELENGLHYTVQEKLWEIIFKISRKMNVKVFVTTHSNDCIRSFSSVLSKSPNNKELGSFSRLDFHEGKLKQTVFSPEEINIAIQNDIEIR